MTSPLPPLSEGLDLPLNIRYSERFFSSLSRLLFRGSHVQLFFFQFLITDLRDDTFSKVFMKGPIKLLRAY